MPSTSFADQNAEKGKVNDFIALSLPERFIDAERFPTRVGLHEPYQDRP